MVGIGVVAITTLIQPLPDWRTHMVIWVVILAAFITMQIVTLRAGKRPTLGELIAVGKQFWYVRLGLFLLWAWTGWHLFVRGTF